MIYKLINWLQFFILYDNLFFVFGSQIVAQYWSHTWSTAPTVSSANLIPLSYIHTTLSLISECIVMNLFLLQNKWPPEPVMGPMVWRTPGFTRLQVLDSLIKSNLTFIAICCERLQDVYLRELFKSYCTVLILANVWSKFSPRLRLKFVGWSYCMYNLQFIHIKFVNEKYLVFKFCDLKRFGMVYKVPVLQVQRAEWATNQGSFSVSLSIIFKFYYASLIYCSKGCETCKK